MPDSSVPVSPAVRRLFPSITDLLFVGLFASKIHPQLFVDGDTAWHLWSGTMVLEHGPGAIRDTLSFTRMGTPWTNVQWLGEAALALAYRHAGYIGVAVLCALAYAATFAWLYRILVRETEHPPAALGVTALAAQVTLTHFLARPVIFSFPLFLAVWQIVRTSKSALAVVVLVPLLTAIWANVHPSAFLAPAIAAYAGLTGLRGPSGPTASSWPHPNRRRLLLVAAVLSLAALGATPWGYAWLGSIVPAGENLGFFRRIEEWQTPAFGQPKFWGLLLFVLVALAARRSGPPLGRAATWWGLGWLAGTLVSGRLAPLAAMAWAPFAARDLASVWAERGGAFVGRLWRDLRNKLAPFERDLVPGVWPLVVGVAALIFAARLGPLYPDTARGFSDERFPARALAVADLLGLGPRVFNGYLWGGYISWTAPGRWQVFIDGRAGFFPGQVLRDYLTITELRPGWARALERWDVDWLLVPPSTPIASVSGWQVAYGDPVAVILTRHPGPQIQWGRTHVTMESDSSDATPRRREVRHP